MNLRLPPQHNIRNIPPRNQPQKSKPNTNDSSQQVKKKWGLKNSKLAIAIGIFCFVFELILIFVLDLRQKGAIYSMIIVLVVYLVFLFLLTERNGKNLNRSVNK